MAKSWPMPLKANRGFTLLEVLIALFVLAIALAAIMGNLTGAITTTGALRERTLALWVADARLTHLEAVTKWPELGVMHTRAREDGRRFVVRTRVEGTALPSLRRIDIDVRRAHRDHTLMRLVGFVRKP